MGPTFLWQIYSANIYLIHVKFGTVKDIIMVIVSVVLDFLFFVVLAGKMTSQNGVKILTFLFSYSYLALMEEGLYLTLKEKIIKISYFNQKIQLLQCQNLLLKI